MSNPIGQMVNDQMLTWAVQGLADIEIAYFVLKYMDEAEYLKLKKEFEETLEMLDD